MTRKGDTWNESNTYRDPVSLRKVRKVTSAGSYNYHPAYHTWTAWTAGSSSAAAGLCCLAGMYCSPFRRLSSSSRARGGRNSLAWGRIFRNRDGLIPKRLENALVNPSCESNTKSKATSMTLS